MNLFHEVRLAKDHLAQLYREMNRRLELEDDVPAEPQP
jgi:hypothetical protein